MKDDETSDPVDIGLLCSDGEVLESADLADLIEEFRFGYKA
jgi:hypothetical protein